MKRLLITLLLAVVAVSFALPGAALAKEQTICPLMGGEIKKDMYADHDGKRVYFCCAGCVAPFKETPAKYIKKLEADGVVLAKTPAEPEKKEKDHDDHSGHNH